MMYDVIVIGAGLAGLIGGLQLAQAGYSVLLLAKGHGATHWAAGTVDVFDSQQPGAAIEQLIATRPDHPYTYAGTAALREAIAHLQARCLAANYPLVGSLERNLLLPSAAGALRPTALVPTTMAAGDSRIDGPILVAGFHELRDFYPPLVAANLRIQGFDARSVYLALPPLERHLDFSTTVFARLFERRAIRESVGRQLRQLRGNATRIALPAILGIDRATEIVQELQEACGALIFEVPTLPPSVPGIRLFELLAYAFRRAGGRMQIGGWVVDKQTQGSHLLAVFTEAAARRQRHTARCFLLATGGIAGGGIRAQHHRRLVETALGLPVRIPGDHQHWLESEFLAADGHPIYRAGIAVDRDLRPLDGQGQMIFDNVTVAGAALGGADLIRERCWEGVALATGWRAAQTLLSILSPVPPQRHQPQPSELQTQPSTTWTEQKDVPTVSELEAGYG